MSTTAVTAEQFDAAAKSVRGRIITAIHGGGKGHLGGALSAADLILFLYQQKIVTPCIPGEASDHPFIMSKGHSATALLAVLDELGVNSIEALETYNKDGSLIGNNPSELVPGIEFHTGSLGHGVGLACGVALANQIKGKEGRVVALISDGELLEGSIWEGLLFAVSNNLDVCVIVDRNNQICEDFMSDTVDVKNLPDVLRSLGFEVAEIDGHDFDSLSTLESFICQTKKPRVVVANTVKGKGVSFMEGVIRWHHSIPTDEEYERAMAELV